MNSRVFRAPGRVNLMGDHTDYTEGLVLPMAVQLETRVTAHPSDKIRVSSAEEKGEAVFEPDGNLADGNDNPDWSRYVGGVLTELHALGRPDIGMVARVESSIPLGRGLSSSAALEVAFGLAACRMAEFEIDPMELAQACRRAEERAAGVECGIMDQAAAAMGVESCALLIDCHSLTVDPVPIPTEVGVVVVDSGVERELADSEYNLRRRECEAATEILVRAGIIAEEAPFLGSLEVEELERASEVLEGSEQPVLGRRVRHVVTENHRVSEMVTIFRDAVARGGLSEREISRLGELYSSSHISLSSDFDAGHDLTDKLVEAAYGIEGVLGARQTGGGWGGSVVVLATGDPAQIARLLSDAYCSVSGITAQSWVCVASNGASEISQEGVGEPPREESS